MLDRFDSTYAVSFEFNSPDRLASAICDQWVSGTALQRMETPANLEFIELHRGNVLDLIFSHDNPRHDHAAEALAIGHLIAAALRSRVVSVAFVRKQVWIGDTDSVDIDVTEAVLSASYGKGVSAND